jgi:hypothetical protein
MPDVLDDPQFLPIITVAGTEKPELFYHYRQYTLSPDSLISLLFYPAVSGAKCSSSSCTITNSPFKKLTYTGLFRYIITEGNSKGGLDV